MTKRIFITLNLLGVFFCALGQEQANGAEETEEATILRNVEVVKEYTPVIKEAGKISTMPELKDAAVQKKTYDFSVWTTPFSIKPSTLPSLDYALVAPEKEKSAKEHYARVGVGTYTSFLGELYTPIVKNNKNLLDFHVLHNSSFGSVKLSPDRYDDLNSEIKSKATTCRTQAELAYKRSIKNKELSATIDADNNNFRYYGYDTEIRNLANAGVEKTDNDSAKQTFNQLGVNLRFRSKDFISKWKYDFYADYHILGTKQDLREHTIHTNLYGAYRFENSSLHITFDMHNIIADEPDGCELYHYGKGTSENNYSVIKIAPRYYFSGKLGEISVGVKGIILTNQTERRKGGFTSDVYGKAKLIKDILYVYAGVTGDYTINSYRQVTEENPYVMLDMQLEDTTLRTKVEDSYMPMDAYVGLTAKIAKRLDMNLHIGYKLIENPHFYINHTDTTDGGTIHNRFDVVYDKSVDKKGAVKYNTVGLFNAGLSVAYDWNERLKLRFDGKMNKWVLKDLARAWMQPKWEMTLEGSYLANDYLRFRLGYNLKTGLYAQVNGNEERMPNAHNLTVGADYKLLNWLNLFINVDNVANQKYEKWYGYTQHGINLMGGATIVF